jgi:hypothetical protein
LGVILCPVSILLTICMYLSVQTIWNCT